MAGKAHRKRARGRGLTAALKYAWPLVLALGVGALVATTLIILEITVVRDAPHKIAYTGRARTSAVQVRQIAESLPDERIPAARNSVTTDLKEAVNALERNHDRLVGALPADGPFGVALRGEGEERAYRARPMLDGSMARMQASVRDLIDAERTNDYGDFKRAARSLLGEASHYLLALDHIDLLVAQSAQQSLIRMQTIEAVLAALCGLLLIGVAVFLLRPSRRAIADHIGRIEEANHTLRFNRSLLTETLVEVGRLAAARQRLLASLGHDLRSPLQTIHLSATVAADDGEALPEHIERIASATRRMDGILEGILSEQASLLPGRSKEVDVATVAEEVLEAHRPNAEERGLTLTMEVAPGVPSTVHTRRVAVTRALDNLVGNAVKYTERGRVELRVEPRSAAEGGVRFVVRDTGPGIPASRLSQIFDQGSRVSQAPEGQGLGLWITKRLARQLGGNLTVESTEGEGSAFTLSLPASPPPDEGRISDAPAKDLADQMCRAGAFSDLRVTVVADATTAAKAAELGAAVEEKDDAGFLSDGSRPAASLVIADLDALDAEGQRVLCEAAQSHEEIMVTCVYSEERGVDRQTIEQTGCITLAAKPLDPLDLIGWMARAQARTWGDGRPSPVPDAA